MMRYVAVSSISGILFGAMDGLINANPFALRLYEVYRPIARPAVNVPAAVAIDLAYGFALAGVFQLLYRALPGAVGVTKGISFALLTWFLRVVMSVASSWVIFPLPAATVAYTLVVGLAEMLVLGMLYGLTLRPSTANEAKSPAG